MTFGEWRSPVAHAVWDRGVAGSNPVSPTIRKRLSRAGVFSYVSEMWCELARRFVDEERTKKRKFIFVFSEYRREEGEAR